MVSKLRLHGTMQQDLGFYTYVISKIILQTFSDALNGWTKKFVPPGSPQGASIKYEIWLVQSYWITIDQMVKLFQIPIKNKAFKKTWWIKNYYTQHTWQSIDNKAQFMLHEKRRIKKY